jgi:hypothetical protein
MADRLQSELVLDVTGLGVFTAKEFPASRQIVEKGTYFDLRARRFAGGSDRINLAPMDDNLRPFQSFVKPGGHPKTGHARDTWERFTAETEGVNPRQIVAGLDFTGGMPLKTEQRVIPIHPHSVVNHADHASSAAGDRHFNPACTCVDAILDEFFHHGSRSLDDFTSGNLVCYFIR